MRIRIPPLLAKPHPQFPQFNLPHQSPPRSQKRHSSSPSATAPKSDSRYLSLTKSRIGKCISFGLPPEKMADAANVLRILGEEWRELTAGYEGFLTGKKYAGLRRHKVVWGEMDCMSHVNNVTYIRYAESARVNWTLNYSLHHDPAHRTQWSTLCTPSDLGLTLRSMHTDYKFPLLFPDRISVFHKLQRRPGTEDTSFGLDVVIFSELHQRVAARCEEDIVLYDYKGGRKSVMPEWLRGAFERTWVEQEAERERVGKRREEVEGLVRGLEVGSWDQVGAVEDMGSSV